MEATEPRRPRKLLVDLDCLLDTRLATIDALDSQVAQSLLESDAYHERFRDDYYELTQGKITQDAFEKRYAARDKEILKRARPTPIIKVVGDISEDIKEQGQTNDLVDPIEIHINTYPYSDLTPEERRALVWSMGQYVDIDAHVTTAWVNHDDLTPRQIKDHWDGVIIYDFNTWFSYHGADFDTVLAPQNLMFAAALYIGDPKEMAEEMEGITLEELAGTTPFEMVEQAMVERIKLSLLQARYFSMVRLDEK